MDFTLTARILALTTATLAFHVPETVFEPLGADAVASLEALADTDLEQQRAGAFEQVPVLEQVELERLEEAQSQAQGLEDQRGGDIHLTDREVQIILWTAVLIAVVFLIA